ncbi:HopJ type III effector protein [Alcanivorax sp. JB21]|uniref:HopJ type III effector protein n=1 Tax=Alcanivorax limicola TaxID=2874102 RepID=UPI001CBC1AF3|nr:HopJ type III effector protein [Alcanivorax limicola]MBZ2188944.1 HopJ type III effector protein [Alcanivorax limicola]
MSETSTGTETGTETTMTSEAALLALLEHNPFKVEVDHVLAIIDEHYVYTPTRFSIGAWDDLMDNPAGKNEIACRIFAFARIHQLRPSRTLACFGHYYRDDIVSDYEGTSHPNLRAFMRHGWSGVHFHGEPLRPRGRSGSET